MALSDRADKAGRSGPAGGGPTGGGREKGVGGGNRDNAGNRARDLSGAVRNGRKKTTVKSKVMRPSDAYNATYAEDAGMGSMQVDPVTGRLGVQTPSFDLGTGLAAAAGLVNPLAGTALGVVNKLAGSPLTVGGDMLTGNDLSAAIAGRTGRSTVPGREGPSRERPVVMPSGRAANQRAPGITRPAAMDMPAALTRFLNAGMTPLQSRTAIATQGVSGSLGQDRDAAQYYRNLLERAFITDQGQYMPYDDPYSGLLPIEQQYLQQVLGLSFKPNTQSILQALSGY